MGFFSKNKDSKSTQPAPATPAAGAPTPPGAPRPPMAPGAAPTPPGAPRPPMGPSAAPTPPGVPRPPMGPGAAPTPPGAPRPPMGPSAAPTPPGAPKPPMGPSAAPTPPGAPRPPMGPGPVPAPTTFGQPPKPQGPSFGSVTPPPAPSFGSSAPSMSAPTPRSDFSSSGSSSLDTILMAKKGYTPPRSARSGNRVTYDQFCAELTYDYLDGLLKSPNLLEQKSLITKIKKTLIFALTNTKDLPDTEREILFSATLRFIDFLKGVVYYPDKDKINEEVITYIPFLKDTAYAFRSFLLKNR